ncbi:MAG: hypothetical protein LBT00_02325 [Spirochaetaceae bacterium]|nr:hypothetical protein [Spirochaetaceae bacterium]
MRAIFFPVIASEPLIRAGAAIQRDGLLRLDCFVASRLAMTRPPRLGTDWFPVQLSIHNRLREVYLTGLGRHTSQA